MLAPITKFTGRGSSICKRNLRLFAPALQKSNDPIQQLFLDKLRDFKSKSVDGKLVDPSPELQKALENDRVRIYKHFNLKPGEDLTKFPSFNFPQPQLELPVLR